MQIGAFIEAMERFAPPALAEEFDRDRIGLVIEGKPEIRRICCALDASLFVIGQAARAGADMLVVHHTPLWTPVTRLSGHVAGVLRSLLAADMNLYVMHTNFDHVSGGVNDTLCRVLSLSDTAPLSLGRIGKCTITPDEISRRLHCPLRIWGELGSLSRLAAVAGSGFDPKLLDEAADLGADAFLSAEMKHSVARSAPIPCIEATHYGLEAPAMQELAREKGWVYIDDPPVLHTVS